MNHLERGRTTRQAIANALIPHLRPGEPVPTGETIGCAIGLGRRQAVTHITRALAERGFVLRRAKVGGTFRLIVEPSEADIVAARAVQITDVLRAVCR